MNVRLIDEFEVKPGQGQAFVEAYLRHYAPGAQARGLVLEQRWVAPPVWLDEQSNTLFFIWSLRGAEGFWNMGIQARLDPAIGAWWREAERMIVSRRRHYAAAPEDLAALGAV